MSTRERLVVIGGDAAGMGQAQFGGAVGVAEGRVVRGRASANGAA